jgi:hypothetical protein
MAPGSRSLLGQLDVRHTQNFEFQVPKDTSLVKVFEILSRFSWPENGFIVFRSYDLVEKVLSDLSKDEIS